MGRGRGSSSKWPHSAVDQALMPGEEHLRVCCRRTDMAKSKQEGQAACAWQHVRY